MSADAVTLDGPAYVYPQTSCMRVRKLAVGTFNNNVYLIECTGQNEVLVVDASATPGRLLPEIGDARVAGIVITHGHPDHTQHLAGLHAALGEPPVYAGDKPLGDVITVGDGHTIRFGEIDAQVLRTPGHTPGSICLLARGHLFSGDTLFPGGPGNTGGNAANFSQIMSSLDRLFGMLPDDTPVSPGHGLDTTIGRERGTVEEWRARGW